MTPDQPIPSTAELWNLIREQRTKMEALEAQVRRQRSARPGRGRSSLLLTSVLLVVLLIAAPVLARSTLADSSGVTTAVSTLQYQLTGSDGSTWVNIDASKLSLTLTPTVDGTVVLSANADLWTSSSGYNQDLGIYQTGPYFSGVVAWKESGGFAGTYSPNAAMVHTVVHLYGGFTYTFTLVWKANKADPGTIWAGAGPISSAYSPTRLTAQVPPGSGYVYPSSAPTTGAILQYDGSNWVPIMTFCPGCNKASADLSSQNLTGAYFPEASLTSANLTDANLAAANLTGTGLNSANLTGAYLGYANLTDANLASANLSSAYLSYANLTNAYLSGATGGTSASRSGTTWSNTICPDNTNSDSDGYTCVGHGF